MKIISEIPRAEITNIRLVFDGKEYEPYECLANHINVRLPSLAHKGNYGFMLYLGGENEGKDIVKLPDFLTEGGVNKQLKWFAENEKS